MDELLRMTAERAVRYLGELNERSVVPTPAARARMAEWNTPLPDGPTDPADVLALLDDIGSPATVASAGPRYFGFVIGGALPASLAANWLAGAWDQDTGMESTAPGAVVLEAIALRWLLGLLGLPPTCAGSFVTGATMANFTALAAARHAVLARAGWDVEANGLFGAPPITVVVGAEVHS